MLTAEAAATWTRGSIEISSSFDKIALDIEALEKVLFHVSQLVLRM
jgi:hypothetical protein